VADKLKVDPVALHLGSNQMFDAIGEASLEFVSHEDGLADAAPGWIGSSQVALGELAARWEARHSRIQAGGCGGVARRDGMSGRLRHCSATAGERTLLCFPTSGTAMTLA
jgi:hypothetical protein